MAVYQAILHFSCNDQGWAEAWYRNTELTDLAAIWDATLPMAQKRQAMLAQGASIKAMSVGFDDVKFDSELRYTNLPGTMALPDATPVLVDSPDAAVCIRFRSAAVGTRKNVFVRGVPDDALIKGATFNNAYTPFVNPATAWIGFLVQNGYGWMGRTVGSNGVVIGYTVDVNTSRITLDTTANFFAGGQVGTILNVTVSRVNGSAGSPLNRELQVEVLDTDQCKTVEPFAVFAFKSPGFIKRFNYGLRVVSGASFQRGGTRKAGKAFGVRPGRARARPHG